MEAQVHTVNSDHRTMQAAENLHVFWLWYWNRKNYFSFETAKKLFIQGKARTYVDFENVRLEIVLESAWINLLDELLQGPVVAED